MPNVLIIGLNELSKKVVSFIKKSDFNVLGFDFDIDKINSFHRSDLIDNDSKILLNDLLRESDIIILNTDFSKYENIFKLLPFIKKDVLILNTNTYKGNVEKIKKQLKGLSDNFIPCNFLLFPNNVVLNHDSETKMKTILEASKFFKDAQIKTSVLNPAENDKIFGSLFQYPFLLENILFRNTNLNFISPNADYFNYDFFYEDILLNKKDILSDIETFLDNIPNIKIEGSLTKLIDENISKFPKKNIGLYQDINDEIFIKIILEKIFIKTFVNRQAEDYLDPKLFIFDCVKYSNNDIKKYSIENKSNVEISMIIMKEKIINLSSFLQFDDLPLQKFMKYIKSF